MKLHNQPPARQRKAYLSLSNYYLMSMV